MPTQDGIEGGGPGFLYAGNKKIDALQISPAYKSNTL